MEHVTAQVNGGNQFLLVMKQALESTLVRLMYNNLWWLCGDQVSIEYGLAELMNNRAIRHPPKGVMETADVPWIMPLDELYALLPSGVLDTSVQPTIPNVCRKTLPILVTPIFQLL